MALVGSTYFQDADPGTPPAAGYRWFNSSNVEKVWDGTQWSLPEVLFGYAPVAGFNALGAITGNTGLAPNSSPDLQTSAKLGGIDLARMTDLTALRTQLLANFASLMAGQIAGAITGGTTAANFAIGVGDVYTAADTGAGGTPYTIPLPQFPDGTTATSSQVVAYGYGLTIVSHAGSSATTFTQSITDGGSRVLTYICHNASGNPVTLGFRWWIIATR